MMKKWAAVLLVAHLVLVPGLVLAKTPSGAYLAGRQASLSNDYEVAASYYARALMQDRRNPELMENALLAFLALGQIREAHPIALNLNEIAPENQASSFVIAAEMLGPDGNIDDDPPSIGPVIDGLIHAWRLLDRGKTEEAFTAFDAMIEDDRLRAFGSYHKALALAQVGDLEAAEELFSSQDGATSLLTRGGTLAHAQVLSQLGRFDEGIELLSTAIGAEDLTVQRYASEFSQGTPIPYDVVSTPREGYAETFHSVSIALNGQAADGFTLLYSRIAGYLDPGNTDSILLTAALLEQLEQFDLATEAYDRVPRESDAFVEAEIGRANALQSADREDAAVEVLNQLSETHPEVSRVHIALGDTLRRMSRFEESSQAYEQAIALFTEPRAQQWPIYYARGITYERIDKWPEAEADFRLALKLNPGQPHVLNYLGYSFVEAGENLDEALGMIEEAAAARPDDGYITDSLGWVFFRLGRYDEAVEPMERAVALTPLDPIINDHLGDVYWAVGRDREAEFQWRRALSFDPEEEEADRIRRKIEVGLDVVLEEEGKAPINVANDG